MTTILFDATRLLRRGGRLSPTGIDRVVLAYARWLIQQPDLTLIPVWTWGERIIRIRDQRFEAVMRSTLAACSDDQRPHHPQWPRLADALRATGEDGLGIRPNAPSAAQGRGLAKRIDISLRFMRSFGAMRLQPGATYINVGHSGLERPQLLAGLDGVGVRSVIMIHDLIPIIYPEFCGPGAAERHHNRLEATLDHASAILTNSEATALAVRDHAARESRRVPPIFVAPLGLEPSFLAPSSEPFATVPYFVCVGTIEPRKNLVFLLKLWRRLAERMGPSTPRLVLVGRRGWENETVLDHLQRSPPVRQFVHEIADLRDDELATLIGGARALLAPSAAEGFDLPVLEALALSTPVIASDIPAHQELAHGAVLIDPTDGPGWFREITAAIARPRRRPTAFAAPTWSEHFKIVEQALLPGDSGGLSGEALDQSKPRTRRG